MGLEGLDPSLRPFYSFSYISNFLLPFEHVGVGATWHVTPKLDVFGELDASNQVAIGADNNHAVAGYLGAALSDIADGKLSITAMARLGPEQSKRMYANADHLQRVWSDLSMTYKASAKMSFTVEANYFWDEGLHANAFGLAGYTGYTLSPAITINARAEIYRDPTGQITGSWLKDDGNIRTVSRKDTPFVSGPPGTYSEVTLGATFHPFQQADGIKVALRPEVRYDRSLSGKKVFNDLTNKDAVVLGADLIIGF